jgi:hypothetical protein
MGEYVQKVRITRAMIRVGANVLAEDVGICGADVAPSLARAVFEAMWGAKDKDHGMNSSGS